MKASDWIMLAACAVLLVAGPAMALQELSRAEEERGLVALTGTAPPLEPAFRVAWRQVLLGAVVVAGVAGTWIAVRVARAPRVRSVSRRLLALLLAGMTLLDLAFLADGRWFMLAPYATRGATVVWLYPLAAVLMGGSVMRLSELEEAFGGAPARSVPVADARR